MKITDKAKKYLTYLVETDRAGKKIILLNDEFQTLLGNSHEYENLKSSIRDAHGNQFPSDWIYVTFYELLDAISGYDIETIEELEELRGEIVDNQVDIYTTDLTKWLSGSLENVEYLTHALEQITIDRPKTFEVDGAKTLSLAQYIAIDDVMTEVINLLSEND